MNPSAAKGPYCFSNSSQLILTAARRYFFESSLNRLLISPIFSKLSPRYSKSSIFFVMTFVTSRSSSFSLSRFCDARASEYVVRVLAMKLSKSINAYGRSAGLCTCCAGCELVNSCARSARYVKASLRG